MNYKRTLARLIAPTLLLTSLTSYAVDKPTTGVLNGIPTPQAQIKPILTPTPPHLSAKAYLLLDANSGKILAEKNADVRRAPSSLTKMMTLYIISDALKNNRIQLDDKIRISKKAWQTGGSRMFVKQGQLVTVEDLIKGIIVDSGNDACVAMAEHLAGGERAFADIMNQYAKALGMTHSHFVDSTGLPNKNHYSNARDMAILARALVTNFPQDYRWYKQKWFKFNDIKQPNRNRLLWRDQSVDGIKTGHTSKAGYCLASSAVRNNMRLVSVVLGSATDAERAEDSQRLLDYGFRFFETHTLYQAAQALSEPRIWQGTAKTIPLGLANTLVVTIPAGSYKQLKAEIELPDAVIAPIKQGQTLGDIKVFFNNELLTSQPLIALKADAKGGLWKRFRDRIGLSFHHWFSSGKA